MKSCTLTSAPVKERLEKAAEEKEAKGRPRRKKSKKGYIKWSQMIRRRRKW